MWPNALAHVLPIEHAAGGDAALTIALLVTGVFGAAILGALLGDRLTRRVRLSLLAAGAAGILLFLGFDLLKESASLGQGLLTNPLLMLGILASFAAGILAIPWMMAQKGAPLLALHAWTIGIALHSLGEGYTLGTEATSADLGSPTGIASFLLHKGMETLTIPILLGTAFGMRQILAVGLSLAAATLTGAGLGLWLGPTILPLLFFAAGAGAVGIVMLRLAKKADPDVRHAAMVFLGVLAVYGAGLLHEIG